MLCLRICTRGLFFKIRTPFLRFSNLTFFGISLWICFLKSDFKSVLGFLFLWFIRFKVQNISSKYQKLKSTNKITNLTGKPPPVNLLVNHLTYITNRESVKCWLNQNLEVEENIKQYCLANTRFWFPVGYILIRIISQVM